jgi:hypothetical protein
MSDTMPLADALAYRTWLDHQDPTDVDVALRVLAAAVDRLSQPPAASDTVYRVAERRLDGDGVFTPTEGNKVYRSAVTAGIELEFQRKLDAAFVDSFPAWLGREFRVESCTPDWRAVDG